MQKNIRNAEVSLSSHILAVHKTRKRSRTEALENNLSMLGQKKVQLWLDSNKIKRVPNETKLGVSRPTEMPLTTYSMASKTLSAPC